MSEVLKVENLDAGYGALKVLSDINLVIKERQAVVIIGSNGSGKTTLLHTITGLIRPYRGRIIYKGEEITHLPPHKKATKGIAFSRGTVFDSLTVSENLDIGTYLSRNVKKTTPTNVFELFPVLRSRLNQKAGSLSGGERVMLSIAKALVSNPDLLILDEPSAGLMPKVTLTLIDLFEKLKNEQKLSFLMAEQNVRMIKGFADYIYVLSHGRTVYSGGAQEILADEQMLRKAYLGI